MASARCCAGGTSQRDVPTFAKRTTIRGFTLLEIMVVVMIMAIILVAGAPTLYNMLRKEGFRKTVSEIVDVCSAARAQAILRNEPAQLIFYPREHRCQVSGSPAGGGSGGGLVRSVNFDEKTRIEILDVNLSERKQDDVVRVTFFPEGTCDEMILILSSVNMEMIQISLEVTTGLAKMETDRFKFAK